MLRIIVINDCIALALAVSQEIRSSPASRVKHFVVRRVSSLQPSAKVYHLFLYSDEEDLNVLGRRGSEVLQNGVQRLHGVETDKCVAGVDEGLHGLVVQGHLVLFHRFLKRISIFVSVRDEAVHATWLFDAQQHLHVFEILDLGFQLELLREVGNDEQRGGLSGSLASVAPLLQDLVQVFLDAFSGLILWQDTFDVHRSCFQAFMILVLTHVLEKALKRNLGISSGLLNNSNGK